ncbi:hypothetical protein F3Y22_tig00000778pilonHSYRG00026 [Hibiscus syriacus]|uniref:Uncharacterized protein n=1 Tax=Hibiscus syriacus TaxID=106335 RepID=A0A6A3D005_HIBSY|nr:hypothetical protein F3Y22_tig00000778pilonHSYRG00026 [Hibiscus syriacus]
MASTRKDEIEAALAALRAHMISGDRMRKVEETQEELVETVTKLGNVAIDVIGVIQLRDAKELENFLFTIEQYFLAMCTESEEDKVVTTLMYLEGGETNEAVNSTALTICGGLNFMMAAQVIPILASICLMFMGKQPCMVPEDVQEALKDFKDVMPDDLSKELPPRGDESKTACMTQYSAFEFLVMPFGLTNAFATFCTLMNRVFHDYLDKFVEHLNHIRLVLERLRENKLFVKNEKCAFVHTQVQFLGHIIEQWRIRMDKENVKAIQEWSTPDHVSEIKSFLRLVNYYRHFVEGYSCRVKSLIDLLTKGSEWVWSKECQEAFDDLKKVVITLNAPRCDGLHQDMSHLSTRKVDRQRQLVVGTVIGARSTMGVSPWIYSKLTIVVPCRSQRYQLESVCQGIDLYAPPSEHHVDEILVVGRESMTSRRSSKDRRVSSNATDRASIIRWENVVVVPFMGPQSEIRTNTRIQLDPNDGSSTITLAPPQPQHEVGSGQHGQALWVLNQSKPMRSSNHLILENRIKFSYASEAKRFRQSSNPLSEMENRSDVSSKLCTRSYSSSPLLAIKHHIGYSHLCPNSLNLAWELLPFYAALVILFHSPTCHRLQPTWASVAIIKSEALKERCLGLSAVVVEDFIGFRIAKSDTFLDLPAEIGLSGKVVLRFAGVKKKSGSPTEGRTCGLGELGRDAGASLWPFKTMRPPEGETVASEDREFQRVGVIGRGFERTVPFEEEQTFEGVKERDDGRADGVEGLAVDGEQLAEGSSLEEHLTAFKESVSDLETLEVKYDQEDLGLNLPCSLPPSCSSFRDTILYSHETLTLEEVYNGLQSFDKMEHLVSASEPEADCLVMHLSTSSDSRKRRAFL